MDIINIKQLATEIRTVEVSGEVYFPGVYPISKNETLSQIIKRAGGFTNDASAMAASFTRESIREAELKRIGQAQAELRRSLILSSQKQGFGEQAGDEGANSNFHMGVTYNEGGVTVSGNYVMNKGVSTVNDSLGEDKKMLIGAKYKMDNISIAGHYMKGEANNTTTGAQAVDNEGYELNVTFAF